MHSIGDGSGVPAFLSKLWTLVEDPSTNDLITWDVSGKSFHVYDQARFSREVLPLYFKHNNIASFIRQLNMYGFRKVTNVDQGGLKVEKDDLEFAHQYFVQDGEDRLEFIKRKVNVGTSKESQLKLKQDDVTKVLGEVRALKGKQDNFNNKMDTLKRENEALWREVASLRQKHMKQQQIVHKLIQFLVTMVGNNPNLGASMKRKQPLMLSDINGLQQPASQVSKVTPSFSLNTPKKTIPSSIQVLPSDDSSFSGAHSHGSSLMIHEVTDASPTQISPSPSSSDGEVLVDSQTAQATPYIYMVPISQATAANTATTSLPSTNANPVGLNIQHVSQSQPADTGPSPSKQIKLEPVSQSTNALLTSLGQDLTQTTEDIIAGPSFSIDDDDYQYINMPDVGISESPTISTPTVSGPITLHRSQSTKDVNDDVEVLQSDLESLKELLSGGSYTFDAATLMGLFHPEGSLTSTAETMMTMPEGILSEKTDSTNNIVGHEVIQYAPPDDITTLFDLGNVTDEDDSYLGLGSPLNISTSNLDTPQIEMNTPLPTKSKANPLNVLMHQSLNEDAM